MAETTTKFVPASTTYNEGYMATEAGTQVSTNNGQASIIVASSRKHANQAAQTMATTYSGSPVELTTRVQGVNWAQYISSSAYSYCCIGYSAWAFHSYYTSIQENLPSNWYSTNTGVTGQQPVYVMQWPNNTNPTTTLTNSLFINMVDSATNPWFVGGAYM